MRNTFCSLHQESQTAAGKVEVELSITREMNTDSFYPSGSRDVHFDGCVLGYITSAEGKETCREVLQKCTRAALAKTWHFGKESRDCRYHHERITPLLERTTDEAWLCNTGVKPLCKISAFLHFLLWHRRSAEFVISH